MLNLSVRSYQQWTSEDQLHADQHPLAARPTPNNKLSPKGRAAIMDLCNQTQYRSCPPAFIVADQMDQGRYWASESTFDLVLHEHYQVHHRGRQKAPERKRIAMTHTADAPNQVWSWDVSSLPGPVKGQWYYLYLALDIFSRKIVGYAVYEPETGELACEFIEKAYWREYLAINYMPLVLHSDNGSPMKAAKFLQKLYDLSITPSKSRPRVSNDNAYSESLFKTLKFRPGFPVKGFKSLEQAREWTQRFVDWYNNEHHSGINYVTPDRLCG